jgi:hypothetical protein
MPSRARVIAAAAVTAALAAGGTSAAVASTTGAKPSSHAKTMSVSWQRATDRALANRLGVSPTRLDQALRAAKTSLINAAKPTEGQFDAALARILGIPQARVRQAFPVGQSGGSKAVESKAVAKAPVGQRNDALIAAVASELHASEAQVGAALRPLYAAGRADPSSAVFAAAARSLGVSTQQLAGALEHAKQSLAGGN